MLTGEINGAGGKLLESLATELSVVYEPTFRDAADWGKAATETVTEFRSELSKFVATVDEAVRGMGSGVTLAKPNPDVSVDNALRQAMAGTGPSPDIIRMFEGASVCPLLSLLLLLLRMGARHTIHLHADGS